MVRYSALKNYYEVEKTIGTGGFAKVKLATHALTGEKVAIKIMDKTRLGDDYHRVKIELEALQNISHHHICKLYQVIETPTNFYMVMEYCSGGELFDHIVEKNRLSESESREFFRQILSAVAYLHQKGYVHRDLKPENILLDKNLNLKLIDFGLCAKPVGGIASHLQTSCGSPTYAAPELIKGHKYLGSEVDVWSMGVLLYALLCGFLPFDCDTIESLYKKILNGRYEEPSWLSAGSKQIIRDMLQVDPKNRIKITDLLSHPWMTMGYYEPVSYCSLHQFHEKDLSVIEIMADYYEVSNSEMWRRINEWAYDYDTATYQLLLGRKKIGLPLKLVNTQFKPIVIKDLDLTPVRTNIKGTVDCLSPSRQSYLLLKAAMNNNIMNSLEYLKGDEKGDSKSSPVRSTRKRTHATGSEDVISPVPLKVTRGKGENSPSTSTNSPATPSTPGKGFLRSIEKRVNKVRNVLTPRKRAAGTPKKQAKMTNPTQQPALLSAKDLCNVSTTSYRNPNIVLEELKKALDSKGIQCKCKGFLLRGKIEESNGGKENCKLSFELEICLVQTGAEMSEPVVGIRRKRLKGDAWCYKKICEQVLHMTNSGKA